MEIQRRSSQEQLCKDVCVHVCETVTLLQQQQFSPQKIPQQGDDRLQLCSYHTMNFNGCEL